MADMDLSETLLCELFHMFATSEYDASGLNLLVHPRLRLGLQTFLTCLRCCFWSMHHLTSVGCDTKHHCASRGTLVSALFCIARATPQCRPLGSNPGACARARRARASLHTNGFLPPAPCNPKAEEAVATTAPWPWPETCGRKAVLSAKCASACTRASHGLGPASS